MPVQYGLIIKEEVMEYGTKKSIEMRSNWITGCMIILVDDWDYLEPVRAKRIAELENEVKLLDNEIRFLKLEKEIFN